MARPRIAFVLAPSLLLGACASSPEPIEPPPPPDTTTPEPAQPVEAAETTPAPTTAPPPAAATTPPEAGEPQERPLTSVLAQGIYVPDPDPKLIMMTKAARFDKTDGTVVIGFCVTINGSTTDLAVVTPFPGDPQIDQIMMDTIAKWRFKPFIVEGKPVKACTQRTFNIRFAKPKPAAPARP